jgi:hypothetical protein
MARYECRVSRPNALGRMPYKLPSYHTAIQQQVNARPDLTPERVSGLAAGNAQGIRQYQADMGNRRPVSFDTKKKIRHAAERNRPDVAHARTECRECRPSLTSARLSSSMNPVPNPIWFVSEAAAIAAGG